MKNNIKSLKLVEFGLKPNDVSKLTEHEINYLYRKLIGEQVTMVSKQDTQTIQNLKSSKKPFQLYEKGELDEKKSPKKNSPFAICTNQLGKEFGTTKKSMWSAKETNKYERCVKDVKKSLKEGKKPLSLFLENEIMRIVEKNITPRITKKELINYLLEDTKSKKGKSGVNEAFMDAPVKPKTKPTTKPGTKPGPKPGTPFRPAPHKQPKPKAKLPEWLKFNNMGIRFKK